MGSSDQTHVCRYADDTQPLHRRSSAEPTVGGLGGHHGRTPRERKLGGHFVFDKNGDAVKAFQVPHPSFVVVLDAAGTVVYTGVGPDQDLEAAIGNVMMQTGMK